MQRKFHKPNYPKKNIHLLTYKVCFLFYQCLYSFSWNESIFLENRSQYNEFERKSLSTARQNQLSNRLKESQTSSTLQSKERKMQNEISPTCCTNCSSPHEYFPGIDHYFDNTECKCSLPFSQTKPIHAYPNDYDVKTNDITKREHDDDDDVIVN